MKNITAFLIVTFCFRLAFSQNLGIGESSPTQKLDVNGWIKVGNESAGSSATTGTFRYHSSGILQFFNGSAWVNVTNATTTFINWGRNNCPSTSTIVYAGYAAGGHYNHGGSGANSICLTNSPNWAVFSDGNNDGNLIYGMEWETSGYGLASLAGFHDYDVSCAVCEAAAASETLMIPGTTNCPSGWQSQYWGYLMANHYTQNKSYYICMNASPMATGSNANSNGTLLYPTETELGSLTGYVQDREMTCVVCTR